MDIGLNDNLQQRLDQCPTLPSLPAVVMRVIEASKDPDIGLAEVSAIIQQDPALTVKILKIANSPLYALRRTVHNLREALTLLGLNAALTIALSFSLVKSLRQTNNNGIDHMRYWQRSIIAAIIARQLGDTLNMMNLEDLFLAGLLQDIGILALASAIPELYQEMSCENCDHDAFIKHELSEFDVDHAQVGAWLLKTWHLPEKLYKSVYHSHQNEFDDPDEINNKFQRCIALSGQIADIWLHEEHDDMMQRASAELSKQLDMDDVSFSELLNTTSNVIPDMSTLFDITLASESNREKILLEARELLLEKNLQIIQQAEMDRRQLETMTKRTEDLEEAVKRDALTSLYNREYFEQILVEEFENASKNDWPLSVAFIDLDNFKDINDNYGHLAGDQVLTAVGQFFTDRIRQTDIFARYGGDEFILMLPGALNQDAQSLLQRLIIELNQHGKINAEGQLISITISIGLATHIDGHHFINHQALILAADEALYQAKQAGRNQLAVH